VKDPVSVAVPRVFVFPLESITFIDLQVSLKAFDGNFLQVGEFPLVEVKTHSSV
jgi:hypothetical protein